MKEYIITLVGAALFCGFVEMLSPDGEGGGIKKHIKLLSSLCILCILIAPLVSFAQEVKAYDLGAALSEIGDETYDEKYDEICNKSIASYSESELGRICEERLMRELDVEQGGVRVDVRTEYQNDILSVTLATVRIYPEALAKDPRDMERIVSEMLGCECEIIYEKRVKIYKVLIYRNMSENICNE